MTLVGGEVPPSWQGGLTAQLTAGVAPKADVSGKGEAALAAVVAGGPSKRTWEEKEWGLAPAA